jgi:diguanylate cyclase (GGDEF)-like protein
VFLSWSPHKIAGILVGAVAVAAITWLRLALAPLLVGSDMALATYILAVLLAAATGGVTAGLTTTLLSLAAGTMLIIGPQAFLTSQSEWIRVAVFMIEGLAISGMIEQLQRRTSALKETALELDVAHRLVECSALEDVMTGLGNRRAFDRDLERSLARSLRDGTPLTVAIADVDGLKHVNDEQGHVMGDALLVAVAQALSGSCRASDGAYRIGGDEFALVLPGTAREDYEALHVRFESILSVVGARFLNTGVSLGAAHAPDDGSDPSALVRAADSRMYTAKTAHHASAIRGAGAS